MSKIIVNSLENWVNVLRVYRITQGQFDSISSGKVDTDDMNLDPDFENYFLHSGTPAIQNESNDFTVLSAKVEDSTYEMHATEQGQLYFIEVLGGVGGTVFDSDDHSEEELINSLFLAKCKIIFGSDQSIKSAENTFDYFEAESNDVGIHEQFFRSKSYNSYLVDKEGKIRSL